MKHPKERKAIHVDPEVTASNLKRLRRIEGQVRGIQKMVEGGRYCPDIMMQLSAVHEALRTVGRALLKGDLNGLLRARRLSRATMRNIRQNLFFAFAYNCVGIPIAAGVLYPATGWLLSPMIASAAMTFSSVSVIANALRLRKLEL